MLSGQNPPPTEVFIDKEEVEEVEDFTYLGGSISNTNDHEQLLKHRIGNQLSKPWSSRKISPGLVARFYNNSVISTLFYGCETRNFKVTEEKKLNAPDSKCIRKILGLKWNDFITNKEVRKWLN